MEREEKEILERRQDNADQTAESYEKPVAYGQNGEPLYARPLQQVQQGPQFVHLSRAVDPVKPVVTAEVQQRHQASVAKYPFLNLSEQEYIVAEVKRHVIGLFTPVAMTGFLVLVTLAGVMIYPSIARNIMMTNINFSMPALGDILLVALLFIALFIIAGYIAIWVYLKNKFFLTNESVIQEIQTGLFTHDEQTVSLANIEDVSFDQHGILQTLLDYGSIRLSTEGDETSYRFSYVARPKKQAGILNNAVEAFKNGRPVGEDD